MSNYDETSRSSILEFSEKLRNKTLLESVPNKYKKDLISQMEIDSKKDNKGSFGTLLEKYYPILLAFISFLYSIYLWFTGNELEGIYVGLWPITILGFAIAIRQRRKD